MMLGLYDYYDEEPITVMQIVPEKEFKTLEIPDISKEYVPNLQPVWKFLTEDWTYSVSENSKVITNLPALKGVAITEIIRWESDGWEAFIQNGSEVDSDDMRIVTLSAIIDIDGVPNKNYFYPGRKGFMERK